MQKYRREENNSKEGATKKNDLPTLPFLFFYCWFPPEDQKTVTPYLLRIPPVFLAFFSLVKAFYSFVGAKAASVERLFVRVCLSLVFWFKP